MSLVVKIFRFAVALLFIVMGMALFVALAVVVLNVRLYWFPDGYVRFIDQTRTDNSALALLGLTAIIFASVLRDYFRGKTQQILNEEQLPVNLFYKISGDVTEANGRIMTNLDVFGNINGNGEVSKITVSINKDKFPFFILREKDERKKIFPGSFLKVTYPKTGSC